MSSSSENNISILTDATQYHSFIRNIKKKRWSHIGIYLHLFPASNSTQLSPQELQYNCLSISLAEYINCTQFTSAIFNLANRQILYALQSLFTLKVKIVGYDLKSLLFFLWKNNIEANQIFWDTQICERALTLNRPQIGNHKARKKSYPSLLNICREHGVTPNVQIETDLNCIVDFNTDGSSPSSVNIQKIVELSALNARLYPLQIKKSDKPKTYDHLIDIEMPWIFTNAFMEWHGVLIDLRDRPKLIKLCKKYLNLIDHHLSIIHRSPTGQTPNDDKNLQNLQTKIDQKILRTLYGLDFDNSIIRVHPTHTQLGAVTGRQTCTAPDVTNWGKALRPLIIAETGYGIGEVDYSQFEVGIAASIYKDKNLLEIYNESDVYTEIAKQFYKQSLPSTAQQMSFCDFKIHYAAERDAMKTGVLSILNGATAYGLQSNLSISLSEAKDLIELFHKMFPSIYEGVRQYVNKCYLKGYATTLTGLRRNISSSSRNSIINFHIQGTATSIFKAAGNELYKQYPPYKARLIIPLHDSFIFEAPLSEIKNVAALTADVMRKTMADRLRGLKPRTSINIEHPYCWNSDQASPSIEKNIETMLNSVLPIK